MPSHVRKFVCLSKIARLKKTLRHSSWRRAQGETFLVCVTPFLLEMIVLTCSDAPKYINFCRGDVVDDSASEADDNYQTAQFPRQSNPAFRSSSPNPSVMSSQASDSQSEASSAMPDPEPSRTARNSRERPIRRDTAESPTSNRTTPRRETFPQESENTPGRRGRSQTVTNNSPPGRPESSHNGSDSADPNVGFGEMVQHQQVSRPLQIKYQG